jgi:universal stress protein A
MTAITRILVPMDFGAHADRAADYALTLARNCRAWVELLHVVEDPFAAGGWGSEMYLTDIEGLRERALEEASTQLDEIRESLLGRNVPLLATVRMGRPAQTIVDYATDAHADLIVMGTRGRTGLAYMITGSVAERVVRTAPCPVLTVGAHRVEREGPVAA